MFKVSHFTISSMYFDEDGDLAHEFYEEVKVPGSSQTTAMRRKLVNLRPQVCCLLNKIIFWIYSINI